MQVSSIELATTSNDAAASDVHSSPSTSSPGTHDQAGHHSIQSGFSRVWDKSAAFALSKSCAMLHDQFASDFKHTQSSQSDRTELDWNHRNPCTISIHAWPFEITMVHVHTRSILSYQHTSTPVSTYHRRILYTIPSLHLVTMGVFSRLLRGHRDTVINPQQTCCCFQRTLETLDL